MRQSIHRGLRPDNKWVYGTPYYWGNGVWSAIVVADELDENLTPNHVDMLQLHHHDVIPETIGQFTHKVDSTGKDIFEGDYLKLYNYLYEVVFDTDTAAFLRKTVAWRGPDNQWHSAAGGEFWHRSYPFHVDPAMNGVVMGNKFDGLLEIVEG